jgi:hypothetical protein
VNRILASLLVAITVAGAVLLVGFAASAEEMSPSERCEMEQRMDFAERFRQFNEKEEGDEKVRSSCDLFVS